MLHNETELSIHRTLKQCISVVEKTRSSLEQRQHVYGMEFEQAVIAAGENRLRISAKELALWQNDVAALPQLEQRLQEYRVALSTL